MGVTTDYLGRIDITPPLNKDEHDYLELFSRSRRSVRDAGPYAVFPRDPGDEVPTLHGDAAAQRYNQLGDGQPSYWCQWVPCPRGCCLGWDGHEKFYAGGHWLQYLIDHFLRLGAHAKTSRDSWFSRFTFDHDTNGVIVGRQQDNRELFALHVEHGEVSREVLQRGDVMPWDPGYVETPELPWLSWEASIDELERREEEAAAAKRSTSSPSEGGMMGRRKGRTRRPPGSRAEES